MEDDEYRLTAADAEHQKPVSLIAELRIDASVFEGKRHGAICTRAADALEQEQQERKAAERFAAMTVRRFDESERWRKLWKTRYLSLAGNGTKHHAEKMAAKLSQATELIGELEAKLAAPKKRSGAARNKTAK